MLSALDGDYVVCRQGEATPLQQLLQARLRIFQPGVELGVLATGTDGRQTVPQEPGDGVRRSLGAAIPSHGAEHGFEGVGQNRGPLGAAGLARAGAEVQERAERQLPGYGRQRGLVDEAGAQQREPLFARCRQGVEQQFADHEAEQRVA